LELSARVDAAEAENKALKESVNSLRSRKVELEALLSKYSDEIRSAQSELQLTKEQFESEIQIRNRLVRLHEDKANEADTKAKQMECTTKDRSCVSPPFSHLSFLSSDGGTSQGVNVLHKESV